MPLKPYQSRIIALLIQQELVIAETYRFYAHLYPDLRDFWDGLAKEELEHATWLEYLQAKAENGSVAFIEGKTKTYTVESFLKYLQDNLAKTKERAPIPRVAFTFALSIESSRLVRNFLDHFHTTDKNILSFLDERHKRLKQHRKRLEVQATPFGVSVANIN